MSPGPRDIEESEPDYRFTLANERTFLAWIRTALGLLAGGVAVHQLVAPFEVAGARTAIALGCVFLAVILGGGAYFRWRSVQDAIRRDEPLPRSLLIPILSIGTGVIAALASAAVVLS
ncbi:YidH family protein [Nocardia sp. CWNU-33]|uniref:YidH family protein n=1 Tax=Nocardia sp. CWNU-33 TaxID=3392117 RepID=UPI00398ED54D